MVRGEGRAAGCAESQGAARGQACKQAPAVPGPGTPQDSVKLWTPTADEPQVRRRAAGACTSASLRSAQAGATTPTPAARLSRCRARPWLHLRPSCRSSGRRRSASWLPTSARRARSAGAGELRAGVGRRATLDRLPVDSTPPSCGPTWSTPPQAVHQSADAADAAARAAAGPGGRQRQRRRGGRQRQRQRRRGRRQACAPAPVSRMYHHVACARVRLLLQSISGSGRVLPTSAQDGRPRRLRAQCTNPHASDLPSCLCDALRAECVTVTALKEQRPEEQLGQRNSAEPARRPARRRQARTRVGALYTAPAPVPALDRPTCAP